jgi:hypothetical protein
MTQLEALLKLGMTEAEAREVLEADKRIDKGENLFEFSAEQKAVEKKMRQADRTPTVYNFNKRERKSDNDKRFLIDSVLWMLTTNDGDGDPVNATEINVINPEREIEFIYNNRKFKIVLSAPRK